MKSPNVIRHRATVTRNRREQQNKHRSVIIWFTGLSGSGKSTLAHVVEERLHQAGCRTFVFDGDNVRHGLCANLTFSKEDRHENIRRIGEVSKLLCDNGTISLTAFISPYRLDRDRSREIHRVGDFLEVHVDCPLAVCEQRDPRGLYARARAGEIHEFTGVSAPYEPPPQPELVLRTDRESPEESAESVISYLEANGYLRSAVQVSAEIE